MGWSIGFSTLVVSSCVLLLWFHFVKFQGLARFKYTHCCICNEVAFPELPQFENQAFQIMEAFIGVLILKLAVASIDSKSWSWAKRWIDRPPETFKLYLAVVRTAIEVFVVTLGWLLGGVAGVGTLLLHNWPLFRCLCMFFFNYVF